MQVLATNGWSDGLLSFNGTNNSEQANQIYRKWLTENKSSDLIAGIPAADRRKALVDEFRNNGRVMIATEAAAKGINLQFCSMLVNYDLPWNPQRVEQRIGRVHRFGQNHNVVVVNFSNKGNVAEERILQLLTEKFQLFTSVFGASDEVLGQIEDGIDFEKNITNILNKCTTAEEINAAFDELEARYAVQIDREMKRTRKKVFDNLDPKVRDKLKTYDVQTGIVLNAFERLLMQLTRYELSDRANFNSNGTQFTLYSPLEKDIATGEYFFKSEPRKGARQYRYSSDLCRWVISRAQSQNTPQSTLTFQIAGSNRASALAKRLRNQSGRLTVQKSTFTMKVGEENRKEDCLLFAGFTDNGELIDQEQLRDILDLHCVNVEKTKVDDTGLGKIIHNLQNELASQVQNRNASFFLQQEQIVEAARRDFRATFDVKIREFHAKEGAAKKSARKASSTIDQLKFTREARQWQKRAEEADDEYRRQRNKFREESDIYLDNAAHALEAQQSIQELFTINWKII